MKTRFIYTGIRVRNLRESIEFYTSLLGMKLKNRVKIKETKGEVANLTDQEGSFVLELNYYERGSPHRKKFTVGEGLDHLAFQVEDMDAFLREAERAGYPTRLVVKTEKSRWAYIKDPNGIWIEIEE